jgi:hypothetical protein
VNAHFHLWISLLCVGILAGCAHQQTDLAKIRAGFNADAARQLTEPFYDPDVLAVCNPPIGWRPDPLKKTTNHSHQVWLSPTGNTAYGVIHFNLPLPVGQNLALVGFINEMRTTEGDAVLLSQQDDPKLGGIRFVAEGGLYHIRSNLIVVGWEGWAVYAGSLRNHKVDQIELDLAQRARDYTSVGRPVEPAK